MSRENRNLIINALSFILLSVFIVLGYDHFTKDDNELPVDDFKTNHIVSEEKTDTGYIFVLTTNDVNYFGEEEGEVIIKLVINDDLTIDSYEFVEYGHTEGFKGFVTPVLDAFITNKKKISDLTTNDIGTTGATNTTTAIVELLIGLNKYLGGESSGEVPISFKDKHVVEELKTATGYEFILDTTNVVYVGDALANVKLKLELDNDLTITSYEFLDYNHTPSFQNNVTALLDSYVTNGKKLTEIDVSEAGGTGSTNTLTALLTLFVDLEHYITNDMVIEEPVELTFKEKHVIEELKTAAGYEFILDTTNVVYVGAATANVKLKLELDNDLTIISYEFLEYNHTPSFQNNVTALLDSYVTNGKKLTEIDVSEAGGTGSTNTLTALLTLFVDLEDYITNDMEQPVELTFKEKHIVRELKTSSGYEFTLDTTNVIYVGTAAANVKLKLKLTNDLEFISYEFVDYNHTPSFQGNVTTLLNSYVTNSKKLSEIDISEATGTGSTNTLTALLTMFIDLEDYILNDMEIPLTFKEKHVISEEKYAGGYNFTLDTTNVVYIGTSSANIKMILELDNDLTIMGYDFLEYNHTPSFQNNVTALLDSYVANGKKLTEIDVSEASGTGSTNTLTALLTLFINLEDYITNEMGGQ